MCRIPPPEKTNEFRFVFTHAIGSSSIFNVNHLSFWSHSETRALGCLNHLKSLLSYLGCQHTSTTFIRWDQLVSSLTTDAISVQCDGVNAMAFCHLQRQPLLSSSFIQIIKDELPRAAFGFGWFWNVSELQISSSTFVARYGYRQSFQQKSKSCVTVDRCLGELSQGARLSFELESQALKRRDWTP